MRGGRLWRSGCRAGGVAAGLALLAALIGPPAAPPALSLGFVYETLSERLRRLLLVDPDAPIRIAPMRKQGVAEAGDWSPTTDDVFASLLARSGVTPCSSVPADTRGRPGFLEFVSESGVLNKGATRATFGWFLRADWVVKPVPAPPGITVPNVEPNEYFLLMSYDYLPPEANEAHNTGEPICAFEVFIFGPVFRPPDDPVNGASAPLLYQMPVRGDGHIIDPVPPELARPANYVKDSEEPYVTMDNCKLCHDNSDIEHLDINVMSTIPFPWQRPYAH